MKDFNLLKNKQNSPIALVGHMGSGKSIIGKLIAKKLNFDHIDTDLLIEKIKKKSINEIFTKEGELFFRLYEETIILDMPYKKTLVISLGGGSILSSKIRNLLKNKFLTIFLDVNLSILGERLNKSNKRPLLVGSDYIKKIKELDIIRRKYYLLADVIITEHENIKETVDKCIIKYNNFYEKNN